jgi:hypothetical protein
MGPGFSDSIADALMVGAVVLLVLGALLGGGCQFACSYVNRHVDVGWKP